jgi:hypothetical protein
MKAGKKEFRSSLVADGDVETPEDGSHQKRLLASELLANQGYGPTCILASIDE